VIGAKWIDETQKWQVSIRRTDGRELVVSNRIETAGEIGETLVEECDIFINATGFVNDWRWPSIPGRQRFLGEMLHSAAWDRQTNLRGKTVALIGNGSSGIQILPAIIDEVDKVYLFIRSPTWVTAPFAQKYAGKEGSNFHFSAAQQKRWAENPDEYLKYRREVEAELSDRFRLYLKDAQEQKVAKDFSVQQMSAKLATKPEILKLLLPTFAVG
jgi:cation diffusion facilitator CzcD-associated flavoprotein CzcO